MLKLARWWRSSSGRSLPAELRPYALAGQLLPRLPRRPGYWLAALVGDLLHGWQGQARAAVLDNLSHVVPEAPPGRRARMARQVFRNQLKNYYDLFCLPQMRLERIRELVRVEGLDSLRQALDEGRGAIVAGPHLGNIEVVAQVAVAYRLPATMGVERLHPPELHALFERLRGSQGIEVLPVDTGLRGILRALRAGRVVGMASDRDTTSSGRWLPFFGRPARLPVGYVVLAARTGAPLFMAFAERLPAERYALELVGPLPIERQGDEETLLERNLVEPVRLMEEHIGRRPEQWVMFERVWDPAGQRPGRGRQAAG